LATSPDSPSPGDPGGDDREGRGARRGGRHVRGGGKTSMREDEEWSDPLMDRDAARRDRSVWRRTRRAQVLASFRGGGFLPRSPLARILLAIAAVLLLLLILTTARAADGFVPVPAYTARVTDQAGMLTAQQRNALEGVLRDYEARSGSQIAVLLVPSTAPEAIEQYGIRVAEAWKLGRKGVDDGVLLLVAKDNPSALRRLRIEAGRGVQGSLTDAQSKRVLQDVIAPHFRQGDYYGGLAAGVSAISTLIDKERLPAPSGATSSASPSAAPSPSTSPSASAGAGGAPSPAAGNAGLGRLADAAGAGAIGGAQPATQPRSASAPDTTGGSATDTARANAPGRSGSAGGSDAGVGEAAGRSDAERGAPRRTDAGGGFGWLLPLVLIGAGWFLLRGRSRRSGLRRGGWGSDASGVLIGAALGNAISNAGRWGHGYGGGGFGGGSFGGGGGFSGGGGGTFDGGGASGDW